MILLERSAYLAGSEPSSLVATAASKLSGRLSRIGPGWGLAWCRWTGLSSESLSLEVSLDLDWWRSLNSFGLTLSSRSLVGVEALGLKSWWAGFEAGSSKLLLLILDSCELSFGLGGVASTSSGVTFTTGITGVEDFLRMDLIPVGFCWGSSGLMLFAAVSWSKGEFWFLL